MLMRYCFGGQSGFLSAHQIAPIILSRWGQYDICTKGFSGLSTYFPLPINFFNSLLPAMLCLLNSRVVFNKSRGNVCILCVLYSMNLSIFAAPILNLAR